MRSFNSYGGALILKEGVEACSIHLGNCVVLPLEFLPLHGYKYVNVDLA